ncbi:MAG: transcriptional repressor [Defluviitaleaceae bacterium]|nr:transcriptional repressor [Defluviitaleaceae bacterium]
MSTKRSTLQRQIILDTIKSLGKHLSAEELYLEIQKKHPIVGKSTIYRNLRQLVDDGVISQIVIDGVVRYDKKTGFHYHFICEVCGGIFDVEIDCDDKFADIIMNKYGFKTNRHEIDFFGVCSNCTDAKKTTPEEI